MKEWYEARLTEPWMKKYFSFEGRIGRKSYILRLLIMNLLINVIGLPLGIMKLFFGGAGAFYYISFLFNMATFLLLMLSYFSLWVRRLHDMDKEGKYLIRVNMVFSLIGVLFGFYVSFMVGRDMDNLLAVLHDILPYALYILIAMIPWILYTSFWGILCIFKKGTEGPNRFGDDPLAPVKTEEGV